MYSTTAGDRPIRAQFAAMIGTSNLPESDAARAAAARDCDWLKTIYEAQWQQAQGYVDRAWTVLQLFVPLSLAPFAAVVVVDEVRLAHVIVLGLASCVLLLSANLFVSRVKIFENESWGLVGAIEAEIGLPSLGAVTSSPGPRSVFRTSVVRWGLSVLVAFLWIILAIAVQAGLLT